MSKSITAFLVVVALLVTGAWYFYTNKTSYIPEETKTTQTEVSTSTTPSVAEEIGKTVEIQSNRFAPNLVQIKKGERVTWVNKDTRSHQVSSNPHPIHNGLPGFDSLKGIKEGGTYSFTFDKVGSWGYHDHLSPAIEGKIIVTEE